MRRTANGTHRYPKAPSCVTTIATNGAFRDSKKPSEISSPRFIDLFAGIGGMRIAFERAGGKCVFTSEWNEMSRRTYHANFECQSETFRGDIREVSTDDIPAHDILLAGFPCQPFSIAGVSKKNALGQPHGFSCETQGTLFFEIERILAEHRPSAFVLENVKHLLRHDRGRTFEVIRRTLEDRLNYAVEWDILDARLQCSPFRLLTLGT